MIIVDKKDRIDYEIHEIMHDLQSLVIDNFPLISNSLEFKNKYENIIERCVSSLFYRLWIKEPKEEQIDYIWKEINVKLNEFYDKLNEDIYKRWLGNIEKQYKDYYKE